NARPHVAQKMQRKFSEFGWEAWSHSPYSPNIASPDYHLFRVLQHFLLGKNLTIWTL
ncbi:Histone-lysine N-methyltransferase SETMAR, partial [Habropoda laboriosa]